MTETCRPGGQKKDPILLLGGRKKDIGARRMRRGSILCRCPSKERNRKWAMSIFFRGEKKGRWLAPRNREGRSS